MCCRGRHLPSMACTWHKPPLPLRRCVPCTVSARLHEWAWQGLVAKPLAAALPSETAPVARTCWEGGRQCTGQQSKRKRIIDKHRSNGHMLSTCVRRVVASTTAERMFVGCRCTYATGLSGGGTIYIKKSRKNSRSRGESRNAVHLLRCASSAVPISLGSMSEIHCAVCGYSVLRTRPTTSPL